MGYPGGLTNEEWHDILDKMIWSFENNDNQPRPIYSEDYDHRYEVTKLDGGTQYKSLNETGTVDWSPVEKHNARVQEGLDLFAKYYLNLWDQELINDMIPIIPGKIISTIVFLYLIFVYNEIFLVYPIVWNFVVSIRNKIRC